MLQHPDEVPGRNQLSIGGAKQVHPAPRDRSDQRQRSSAQANAIGRDGVVTDVVPHQGHEIVFQRGDEDSAQPTLANVLAKLNPVFLYLFPSILDGLLPSPHSAPADASDRK
jgi:hypothetical protein